MLIVDYDGKEKLYAIFNKEEHNKIEYKALNSLISAIDSFAGAQEIEELRTLAFTNIRIGFYHLKRQYLVIVTDPYIDIDDYKLQFQKFIEIYLSIFQFKIGVLAKVTDQIIIETLLNILYLFNLKSFEIVSEKYQQNLLKYKESINSDTLDSLKEQEMVSFTDPKKFYESNRGFTQLLRNLFNDLVEIEAIGFLNTTINGGMDTYFEGTLDVKIYERIFHIVLEKSIEINKFLITSNELGLDLDDRALVFYRISPNSLMFMVGPTETQIDNNKPIVDKFVKAVLSLFPRFNDFR
jgi:hypothetical protein